MSKYLTINELKIIGLSSIGGALEFFEFTIYAIFSQYIATHFFPNKNTFLSLIATFGVYALGYIARPLGGIVFGHFGDKYGRKNAFTLAILLMSFATLFMGCLPSYQTIGVSAPILLLILRLIQGFSVGGEISGATVFTAEHLPLSRRGLGIGIVFMGITLGNSIGGLVGMILTFLLGESAIEAWGFRLPFLFGFLLGIFSYFIRKNTLETPIFQNIAKNNQVENIPFLTLSKYYYKQILIGISLMSVSSTVIAFLLYLPIFLINFVNFKINNVFFLNVFSFTLLSLLTALFGFISDYVNRIYLMFVGCIVTAIISYIGFHFFLIPDFYSILIFISLLTFGASIVNGCYALLITELFPPHIRYSGMGVSYTIGVAIFGGLGPLAFTFITHRFESMQAPYYYLLFCILLTVVGFYPLLKSTMDCQSSEVSLNRA